MIFQFLLHPDHSVAFPYISPSCRELYELEPEEIQRNPALSWTWFIPMTASLSKSR